MLWIILAAIGGCVVGGGVTYLVCRKLPQIKVREIDKELLAQEELIKESIASKMAAEEQRNKVAEEKYQTLLRNIQDVENLAAERGRLAEQLAEEQLDSSLTAAGQKYQEQISEYEKEYLAAIKECAERFHAELTNYQAQIAAKQDELSHLEQNVVSAVEAAKRAELERTAKDFYRMQLEPVDIEEIAKIRTIEPFLRNKEALNKVIWKVYYEKPCNDLIGRVIGSQIKCGIYKITNMIDGKCYIGQAVDLASRWKQHIKRGIGAEAPTRNKLYPAMLSIGAENFMFEILQECPRNELNEREKYWISYFQSKEYGYNVTAGGA